LADLPFPVDTESQASSIAIDWCSWAYYLPLLKHYGVDGLLPKVIRQ